MNKMGLSLSPTTIGEKTKGSLFFYNGSVGLYVDSSSDRGIKVKVLFTNSVDSLYIDGSLYTITTNEPIHKLISNNKEISIDEFGFHYDFYGVKLVLPTNFAKLCAEFLSGKPQQSNDTSTAPIVDELMDFERFTGITYSASIQQSSETMRLRSMSESTHIIGPSSPPTRNDTSSGSNSESYESTQLRMYRQIQLNEREANRARQTAQMIASAQTLSPF